MKKREMQEKIAELEEALEEARDVIDTALGVEEESAELGEGEEESED